MQVAYAGKIVQSPRLAAFAAAAIQFAVIRLIWPDLSVPIGVFLAIVALICTLQGLLNISRLGERALLLYSIGYVALFLFFMFWLGGEQHRALLFGVVALSYAAFFHHGALLGYLVIVLIAYFIFPFHALPVLIILSVFYALFIPLRKAAIKADNYAITLFFLVSLVLVAVVFFPLIHFAVQRAPQDLARTLLDDPISKDVQSALWLSFITSTIATTITLLLGLPLAYIMVRADFKGKSILDVAIDIPILIPGPVLGLALLFSVGDNTDIGTSLGGLARWLAELVGSNTYAGEWIAGFSFEGAAPGIILAQIIVSMPFLVRSAMTSFSGIDPRLEHVSRTLGAGPLRTIFGLTIPLASRGIFIGCILAWSRAISEFASVYLLAQTPYTGPTYIFWQYEAGGGATGPSASVAIIMLLICVTLFALLHTLGARVIWKRST